VFPQLQTGRDEAGISAVPALSDGTRAYRTGQLILHQAGEERGKAVNVLVVFMAFSLILGLWIKPRVRSGGVMIAVAAIMMVLFFWLFPSNF
jgi:hypothetical protein